MAYVVVIAALNSLSSLLVGAIKAYSPFPFSMLRNRKQIGLLSPLI